MHAALITGHEQVEFREFAEPRPEPEQVVVDIRYCGICGTDIHAYTSGQPYNPTICGHEWVGTVAAVGAATSGIDEGDRVIIGVPPGCGACDPCRAGQAERCTVVLLASLGRGPFATPHGGFAPQLAVAAGRALPADPALTDEQAALIEPTTICFHAVRRTQPRLGEMVVVQGAGPIGLLTLQLARAAGAAEIVVIEPSANRRHLAAGLGATSTVPPDQADDAVREASGGLGADVVYECAGTPTTIQRAVDLARRGGRMSLIGLAVDDASISPTSWLVKEIQVQAALAYTHEEFEMAMGYVADGRIDVDALHTDTIGLSQLGDRLGSLAGADSADVKVLVDPSMPESSR